MKFFSLPVRIFIAIALAVAAGFFFGDLLIWLSPIGDSFVMLLKMSILPYIVVALIHGVGSLHSHEAFKLLKVSGLFLIAIWAIVIGTLFALTLVFPLHSPAYFYAQRVPGVSSIEGYVHLFIPGNPFLALSDNIVPAVVVFCLFFGAALMFVKRELKDPFLRGLEVAIQALSRITRWIIQLAPIGVFALVAHTVGTVSFHQLEQLALYLVAFFVAALFFTFWALPALVTSFTRVSYREFVQQMQSAVLLAWAAGNIFVSLPLIFVGLEEIAARHQFLTDDSRKVAKTLIPIAYNLPLVGNLMAMFFVLFLGSYYAIDFNMFERVHLVAASILTLAGPVTAALNSIAFLIEALRLPPDSLALFAETFSITRNFQGMAGAMGVGSFTLLAMFAFTKQLHFRGWKLLVNLIAGLGMLAVAIFVILWMEPTPRYSPPQFLHMQIQTSLPAILHLPGEPLPLMPPRSPDHSLLAQIRDSTLRVGYNPNTIPFAYFNDRKELVGYDIQLVYNLAQALDLKLEFIPFDFDQLENDLQTGKLDLAVSGVSVTSERLQKMNFTSPTAEVEMVFIVPADQRTHFANQQAVAERSSLTLGILKGSSLIDRAQQRFPQAKIVELQSYDDYPKRSDIDGLIWTDKEGLAWVRLHPEYTLVEPIPRMDRAYYAFAIPLGAEELLDSFNYWLQLRRLDETLPKAEKEWIKGEPEKETRRWSVIRNVLHWIQ